MDPNIPDGYEEIYQNNWSVIRERVKVGRFKDTYHFPLFTILDSEISQKVEHVLGQYNQSIKINNKYCIWFCSQTCNNRGYEVFLPIKQYTTVRDTSILEKYS